MFLQNLLKKLVDFFESTKKNSFHIINKNYIDITKYILIFGGIVTIFIFILSFIVSNRENQSKTIVQDDDILTEIDKDMDVDILINNELLFPENRVFDITSDYIDLFPMKELKMTNIDIMMNDYEKILQDSLESNLNFNFEKRR